MVRAGQRMDRTDTCDPNPKIGDNLAGLVMLEFRVISRLASDVEVAGGCAAHRMAIANSPDSRF